MRQNDFVRLTKIFTINPTDPRDDEQPKEGYWLKGRLLCDVKRGEPLCVERFERSARRSDETSPVVCAGLFESSPVILWSVNDDGSAGIKTQNSIWRLEPLSMDEAQTFVPDPVITLYTAS